MAKASIDTGQASQPVHTRTTSDTVESQVAVVGIDGSDSVVPASATRGLLTDPGSVTTADVDRVTADSTQAVTLFASYAERQGAIVFNESAGYLYLKYGATAAETDYTVRIPGNGYWEMPPRVYTGIVTGRWAAGATGAAQCTEWPD